MDYKSDRDDKGTDDPVKRKDEIIKMLLVSPNLSAEELTTTFVVTAKTIGRDFPFSKMRAE